MFYLTLKRNYNYKFSYILVLMNSKRRILRKIGTFAYNKNLGMFVFIINFIQLLIFLKNGVFFSKNFYRFLYFYINYFKL
jgi:hypothetical protein